MSGKTRVLLHVFPGFALGGAQARVVALANAWARADEHSGEQCFSHLIVAMDGVFDAGARFAPEVNWEPLSVAVRKGAGFPNQRSLRRILSCKRPELLITYNWGSVEWAAANLPARVPHLHVEDGFGPEEALRQLPRRVWTRRLLLGLRGVPVAVPSRSLKELARTWWVRPDKLHYIPNGVTLKTGAPREVKQSVGRPLVIGTVAGLRPEKNLKRLIRAFADLRRQRSARLVLVGEGSERASLEAFTRELGVLDSVRFTGFVSRPRELIRQMDILALSSETEQQPLALLEAMAEGVPVVATRVGDVQHMLPPEAQTCISERNDEDFTRVLIEVALGEERWTSLAAAGQAYVKANYSFELMERRWKSLLMSLYGAPAR